MAGVEGLLEEAPRLGPVASLLGVLGQRPPEERVGRVAGLGGPEGLLPLGRRPGQAALEDPGGDAVRVALDRPVEPSAELLLGLGVAFLEVAVVLDPAGQGLPRAGAGVAELRAGQEQGRERRHDQQRHVRGAGPEQRPDQQKETHQAGRAHEDKDHADKEDRAAPHPPGQGNQDHRQDRMAGGVAAERQMEAVGVQRELRGHVQVLPLVHVQRQPVRVDQPQGQGENQETRRQPAARQPRGCARRVSGRLNHERGRPSVPVSPRACDRASPAAGAAYRPSISPMTETSPWYTFETRSLPTQTHPSQSGIVRRENASSNPSSTAS